MLRIKLSVFQSGNNPLNQVRAIMELDLQPVVEIHARLFDAEDVSQLMDEGLLIQCHPE